MPSIRLEAQSESARDKIVPFPEAAARPQRVPLAADERKGVILLFTGVRYERIDQVPTPPFASNGSRRRRS